MIVVSWAMMLIPYAVFGLIAALTMLAQVLLGLFGMIIKKRPKYWAYLHRIIAVCILIAILIHIA